MISPAEAKRLVYAHYRACERGDKEMAWKANALIVQFLDQFPREVQTAYIDHFCEMVCSWIG